MLEAFKKSGKNGRSQAEELEALIVQGWARWRDRGAEERKDRESIGHRGVLVQIEGLRQDPHLEMHTRGG